MIGFGLLSEFKDSPFMHEEENNSILANDADDLLSIFMWISNI